MRRVVEQMGMLALVFLAGAAGLNAINGTQMRLASGIASGCFWAILFAVGAIQVKRGYFIGRYRCPQCAEKVREDALVCGHCGTQLSSASLNHVVH